MTLTYLIQRLLSTIPMQIETIRRNEEGQGLAEYALILALIAAIAAAALTFLGNDITSLLSSVAEKL